MKVAFSAETSYGLFDKFVRFERYRYYCFVIIFRSISDYVLYAMRFGSLFSYR